MHHLHHHHATGFNDALSEPTPEMKELIELCTDMLKDVW